MNQFEIDITYAIHALLHEEIGIEELLKSIQITIKRYYVSKKDLQSIMDKLDKL